MIKSILNILFSILLLIVGQAELHAQFAKGTKLFGPTVSATYQNTKFDLPSIQEHVKRSTAQLNQQYTIDLPYAYFYKDNLSLSAGVNYSLMNTESLESHTDTGFYDIYESKYIANRFGISGALTNYYAMNSSVGLYHSVHAQVVYGITEATSGRSHSADTTNNIPTNYYDKGPGELWSVSAGIAGGAYARLSSRWLLVGEIQVIGLSVNSVSGMRDNSRGRGINQNTLSIATYGALTPRFNLGNVGIGLRYLIPARN